MEGGDTGGGPGPGTLELGGIEFLQRTAGSLLSSYGWYILLAAVAVYVLFQKLSQRLAAHWSGRQGAADAVMA